MQPQLIAVLHGRRRPGLEPEVARRRGMSPQPERDEVIKFVVASRPPMPVHQAAFRRIRERPRGPYRRRVSALADRALNCVLRHTVIYGTEDRGPASVLRTGGCRDEGKTRVTASRASTPLRRASAMRYWPLSGRSVCAQRVFRLTGVVTGVIARGFDPLFLWFVWSTSYAGRTGLRLECLSRASTGTRLSARFASRDR